jgi:hypothetical protein
MSKSSDKRAKRLAIQAYRLATKGLTNEQIAAFLNLKVEQIPGKIERGRQSVYFGERKQHVQSST